MSRLKFIILMAIWLSSIPLSAITVLETRTGRHVEASRMPIPKRHVDYYSDGVKITYEFDSLLVIENGGSIYYQIEQFGLNGLGGQAYVPMRTERINVPSTASCVLQVIEDDYIDKIVDGFQPAIPDDVATLENTGAVRVPSILPSSTFLPASIASMEEDSYYRNERIANLLIVPVQYRQSTKTARIHRKISILLSWDTVDSEEEPNEYLNSSNGLFESMVLSNKTNSAAKKAAAVGGTISEARPQSFLMLVPTELDMASSPLFNWKRTQGYNVVKKTDDWTTDKIREAVKDFYDNDPNAFYVLFIGDYNLMPGEYRTRHTYLPAPVTDLHYICMDGDNDYVPDLFSGRIPVSTPEELITVSRKIIDYEMNPDKDTGVKTFVGISYFQNKVSSKEEEERDFVRTTETICQELEDTFKNVKRLYCQRYSTASPSKWSYRSSVDFPFPDHLKAKGAFTADSSHILTAFNGNANIIFHRDHGSPNGWEHPKFVTEHIADLTNNVTPVVFSVDCQTGMYTNANNFTHLLLSKSGGGCVSSIAATESTYTFKNDMFSLSMMKTIWPNKNFRYHNAYHNDSLNIMWQKNTESAVLGEVMVRGLLRMALFSSQDMDLVRHNTEAYHCFGDPSLNIYWGKNVDLARNISFTPIKIGNRSELQVSISGGLCATIAFYDPATGKNYRCYGNSATFKTTNPNRTCVYAYIDGAKPVFIESIAGFGPMSAEDSNSISACHFSGDVLNVTLKEPLSQETQLRISCASNISVKQLPVSAIGEASFEAAADATNGGLYFVDLIRNGEIIEHKTIIK